MLIPLQVVAIFLVGVAMSMALSHALEYPGKLRLDEQTYFAVQAIYYPGFTLGGIGEILAVIATLALVIAMRNDNDAFWWALASFLAVLVMHAVFWFVTQPVNRYWVKNVNMGESGERFFGVENQKNAAAQQPALD